MRLPGTGLASRWPRRWAWNEVVQLLEENLAEEEDCGREDYCGGEANSGSVGATA